MLKKTIAIIILIVGLLLVFSPFIKNGIVRYLSSHNKIENYSPAYLKKNNEKKATFDYDSVRLPSMTSVLAGAKDYDKGAVVGAISVPSIDIGLLIFKGTNTTNLLAGATTMLPDQEMGKGNYPLAGHHMRQESMLFGPLMEIQKDAKVYVTNRSNLYEYQIEQVKIVDETDVSVLKETDNATITLITCDKPTETKKRFVAIGKLVKTEKLTKELEKKYFMK